MFWKFHLVSSGLDTLLSKEDVTLKEVLDEEDILQECKTQNAKLTEFLAKDEVLPELLDYAINLPPESEDERLQFKYSNLACEVISSSIDAVIDKIATEKVLLDKIWGYLDNPPPLNPLVSSFFSKIVGTIMAKRGPEVFDDIICRDVVDKLLSHLEVSAVMEVFIKLMSVLESQELKIKMENWLEENQLVQKLVRALNPSQSPEMHCNASNLLSELVRMGRESAPQTGEADEPNRLFLTIEKDEVLSELLDNILSDDTTGNAESSLVNGMDLILSLIEFKRPNPEGLEEFFTPMNAERIAQGVQSALKAITPRLKDFHKVLVDPPQQSAMLTTAGTLDPPLGKVRLHVSWLISAVISTNTHYVNHELTELGTVNVLLDLFFKYEWNNFLHTYVEHCISSILCNELQDEDEDAKNPLLSHLICDCCLISRIVEAWNENETSQARPGGLRSGYMGHLTRIANNIAHNTDKGPNAEILQTLFTDLSEDVQASWNRLLEGSLNDLNTKNTTQMQLSSHMLHSSSSDDDDGMFKSVSILQYENSLQQAFSNYQVQQLSNEFIESFGHNEEDLNESSKSRNPFDEIGNVDFSINANEETPDAQLFEAVCNEKIHRFDDSGSDEEDIWEEKEFKFSPKLSPKRRTAESNSDESGSSSEESSSSDEEAVFADERKQNSKGKQIEDKTQKETEDKMEVDVSDADWAANFDNDGVAMDTLDATSVGWVDASATSVVDIQDETGFADFTDISKISCGTDQIALKDSDLGSPVAMDEDSNDAFKTAEPAVAVENKATTSSNTPVEDVKMEEDTAEDKEIDAKGEDPEQRLEGEETKIEESTDTSSPRVEKDAEEMSKEQEATKGHETEMANTQNNLESVKVDVVKAGDDPLLVTSQVLGGFVVIDSPKSPTESKTNAVKDDAQMSSPSGKSPLNPARSGVSVVTISSRKVININSDGKIETQPSFSPSSPNHSKKRPKSPRARKTPESPKSSTSLSSPNHASPSALRTEVVMEAPRVNGPVNSLTEQQPTNQLANNMDSTNVPECTSES